MLKNYFLIAWRQILKNKVYAAINVLGLMMGLAVFVFGVLLVGYERSHDHNWANADRIYSASTLFSPAANIGVNETFGIYTAFAPFIDEEIPEVEEISRTVGAEFLISHENNHYYEFVRFADSPFTRIFDLEYIEGDARALDDPTGVIVTEELATKYFGEEPALGKTLTLDHKVSLHVAAVVKRPPSSTHFTSSLIGESSFGVVAPLEALNAATGYDLQGNFNNLSSSDFTYMLLEKNKDRGWLQASIDGIYDRYLPERGRELITGLNVRPIDEANTLIWDATGLPVLDSIQLLGFLVLVVAIVNYTNLATAQSMGRGREIGLRKTMGAGRRQLISQFLVESTCVAVLAMLIALALIEISIPAFNTAGGRGLAMNYADTLPWLVLTTLGVGLVAGAYPAYMITRTSPIDALRDGGTKGARGAKFRGAMLVLQFSISIFMLAMVMVIYFQNNKIEDASRIYPKSEIVTLKRMGVAPIQSRMSTLRNELLDVPGVEAVTYSSLVPYLSSNSAFDVTRERGDETQSFLMTQIIMDQHFLDAYNIPLLAGRDLSQEIAADSVKEGVLAANVLLNELALAKLGFDTPEEAIGKVFWDVAESREPRAYTIVGVFPNQNFRGFHNVVVPTTFLMTPQDEPVHGPDSYRYASIRVQGAALADALSGIEKVWDELITDYPIQTEFLDDTFADTYKIYASMTFVFGGFAFVALTLSLVGLFGLAAFMAGARTKEIGIRKVMGASVDQIVRLLIWQFSRPVLWALPIALPLAYLAANEYLNFFGSRLEAPAGIVAFAGLMGVVVAWVIVAIHAVRIAQANPIRALRYE